MRGTRKGAIAGRAGTRQGNRRAEAAFRQFHANASYAEVTIRFLPYSAPFENVAAQIKSGSVAYSLYALARLFLEKPERYEVRLTGKAGSPLYQLGKNGAVSLNREFSSETLSAWLNPISIRSTSAVRADQGKFLKCGAMPIERDASWADQPS